MAKKTEKRDAKISIDTDISKKNVCKYDNSFTAEGKTEVLEAKISIIFLAW
jgi:hypothetical protein